MTTKKTMFLLLLVSSQVAKLTKGDGGFSEEKRVVDMINKQKVNIKKKQEEVDKLLTKIVAAIDISCAVCPLGWVRSGGSCYYANDTITTKWKDARAVCNNLGGDLVVITSAEENDFVCKLAMEQETVTEGKAWIGLKKNPVDSKWYWVDGTPLERQYKNWGPGEPNNDGLLNENCGHFFTDFRKWNDAPCEFIRDWAAKAPTIICEKHLLV